MAARYAKGRRAWGECARSGKRLKRKDMVEDGYVPGLLVAPDWYDGPHPLDKPVKFTDPIAIRRPAPRRDKSQDSYGPDERFDDEQLMTKPHLVASLGIGPFSIQTGGTFLSLSRGAASAAGAAGATGLVVFDSQGRGIAVGGGAASAVVVDATVLVSIIDDDGNFLADDNGNHILGS